MSDAALPQDPEPMRQLNAVNQAVVKSLLESGAINFDAIGQTIAQHGPALVMIDDYELRFCGSDMRVWKWPRPRFEELGALVTALQKLPTARG